MKRAKLDARSSKFRGDPGKEMCQKWHAQKRAKQRIGIQLTDELIGQIVSCIKKDKESAVFKLKFVENQSKRLVVYEITFEGKETIKLVYDRFRATLVTFLFPEDAQNVYHFYDIFGNKVNIKHEYGKIGTLKDGVLDIPGETIELLEGGIWIVREGLLKSRTFNLDEYGELQECLHKEVIG